MVIRHPCPASMCGWFHQAVATTFTPDPVADVPPWCLPTWAVVPPGYGHPLTDTQIIAAHVATHTDAERTGRMPSRAEIESTLTNIISPQLEESAP